MKKLTFLFLIFVTLNSVSFGQIYQSGLAPLRKQCSALGRPDLFAESFQFLDEFLPSSRGLDVSQACMKKAGEQIHAWHLEDRNNWEQISNQLCSAKTGWVEHNPGTCQAGGPPPICTANHWYRDPNSAMKSFKDRQKAIAQQRFESLMSSACSCTGDELEEKVTVNRPKQDTSNPYNINTNPFVIPCSSSPCPPGTSCKNGVCQAPTYVVEGVITGNIDDKRTQGNVTKAIDYVTDEAKKEAIEKSIELISKVSDIHIPATLKSIYKKITNPYVGILESPALGTHRDLYEKSMRSVGSNIYRLRSLYGELNNYYKKQPARAPKMITAEIQREKESLRKNMADLNIYYVGTIRQRELPRYTCQNVFEFQNRLVNQSIVNILSLPEPSN